MRRFSLGVRLTAALAVVLLAFGLLVAGLVHQVNQDRELESLQRLSHGLARHIVAHWPEVSDIDRARADRSARDAVIHQLMAVNPSINVYVLDADGKVDAYLGPPGMVREPQVDLDAVRAFLAGATLPLLGTDPMGGGPRRVFSAAMFPSRPGDSRPPGYLYVVLDGAARTTVARQVSPRSAWLGLAGAGAAGLLALGLAGAGVFRRLTRPLRAVAQRMQAYSRSGGEGEPATLQADEVQAIGQSFDGLVRRIESQARREREQVAAHRDMIAGVAHDLRTPLTALHGHLEALAGRFAIGPEAHEQRVQAALKQSDKVRRLSQQLFELAALQSTEAVLHRERFHLEDVVTDTVQKFELSGPGAGVTLHGAPPGQLALDGDLQLIERALTNLIDNAIRHGPATEPVRVSVERDGSQARVLVEDGGQGLPPDVAQRLDRGMSLRDPPLPRPGGGIGGLGLAIAQRVAVLHGGSLKPLPSPGGGTRLCLLLPLAA
jgi:signal transduction histidine kinase